MTVNRRLMIHALNFSSSQTFAGRTLGVMAWIMPAFVICSTFGSTNGAIFTQSRLFFVGARKGQFPEAFSLVHADYLTPVPAIVLHVSHASGEQEAHTFNLPSAAG